MHLKLPLHSMELLLFCNSLFVVPYFAVPSLLWSSSATDSKNTARIFWDSENVDL